MASHWAFSAAVRSSRQAEALGAAHASACMTTLSATATASCRLLQAPSSAMLSTRPWIGGPAVEEHRIGVPSCIFRPACAQHPCVVTACRGAGSAVQEGGCSRSILEISRREARIAAHNCPAHYRVAHNRRRDVNARKAPAALGMADGGLSDPRIGGCCRRLTVACGWPGLVSFSVSACPGLSTGLTALDSAQTFLLLHRLFYSHWSPVHCSPLLHPARSPLTHERHAQCWASQSTCATLATTLQRRAMVRLPRSKCSMKRHSLELEVAPAQPPQRSSP